MLVCVAVLVGLAHVSFAFCASEFAIVFCDVALLSNDSFLFSFVYIPLGYVCVCVCLRVICLRAGMLWHVL